jgi:hypothetical protein
MLPDRCWLFRIVVEDEVSLEVVGDSASDVEGNIEVRKWRLLDLC